MSIQKTNQNLLKSRTGGFALVTALIAVITLGIFACVKPSTEDTTISGAGKNEEAKVSAQPLPGGKANFSAVVGNLDTSGGTVVRIGNYTFDASAGTVAYTYWHWDNTLEKGKTAFNIHTCTQDGISKTVNTYTPTGWVYPSGQYNGRSGSYTYNTTTGVLSITWAAPWAGVTESWDVTNPDALTAKLSLRSNNYGLTHGRGYGSNAAWSVYKTATTVPRIDYPGYRVTASSSNGTTVSVTPTGAGAWYPDALNLSSYTSSANGLTLHTKLASSPNVCLPGAGCASGNTHTGIVYHLASQNNGRSMVYNHFCACLPQQSDFPSYTGNLHPYAMQQIIDDNGDLRGFVGIEQQDQAGSAGYQYQLKEYFQ